MRSPVFGVCHICGETGKLSFEHSPPTKAFNDDPIVYAEMKRLIAGEDLDNLIGKEHQRGAGAYTLCERCNALTGHWYGGSYVKMAKHGMELLQSVRSTSLFHVPFRIQPLNVIKQVVCMFMSSNGPKFHQAQPQLARFVLNPEMRHLPEGIRIYAFYTVSDRSRSSGPAGMISGIGTGPITNHILSETTFPPFGFVMTFISPSPDERLTDITHFAEYKYKQERTLWLQLPVLPVYTFFPADYRTREQVLKDAGRIP